ncbi:endo-1,4-beta-xylanase [Sorangium sp. So ce204]|uniref:endo-1,4-beta-xylanase n=1 Tax=Sorangium sp. So ce204 TaxID=3133288 RepID=UPI003F619724
MRMRFERWTLLTTIALSACISAEQLDEDGYELDELAESVTIDTAATYTITGVQSGKCVEVAGGSTADAAAMQIASCNGSTRQQFRMESAGGGYYRIRNVNSNRCMDVAGASTSDGARIQQYSCWSGENQQWSFTDVASGVVRLTARNSGKSLDVYGRGTADGTAVIQWASNGGTNQQFRITPVSSGTGGTGGTGGSGGTGGGGGGGGGGGTGGKFVGNITTGGQVRADLSRYWNQLSPENEGKWGSVEPTRDVMNWAGMDRVRDYARQKGIPYKGHTLIWGAQQPGWIANLSQSEQRAEVEEWIQAFCQRYPDVAIIDVVNEPPPHTTPSYMNALGGAGSSGYDWIVQAFKWARQYCPNAKLLLNDYNNIEYSSDNQNTLNIVNRIRAAGAPIDGIGAQAHDAYKLNTSTVKGFLDRLAGTGLPVYITEYDINLANDTQQLNVMQSQFPMFYEHPSVKGITLWGYISGQTWVANSGLMSSSGQMRPAMSWLMSYLGR